jgi:hypothetical protein
MSDTETKVDKKIENQSLRPSEKDFSSLSRKDAKIIMQIF